MSMTLAQVRSLAQIYLDQPGTSAITAPQWLAILNAANLDVWRLVVAANPSHHQVRTAITWPASTESLDISGASYLNAAVYKLVQFEVYSGSSATLSPSNVPTHKLCPVPFADRVQALSANGFRWPSNSSSGLPTHYWVSGETTVGLTPIPSVAVAMGVWYVPSLTTLTSSDDATQVLGAKADNFHDVVAYRAAVLANSKAHGANPTLDRMWADAQDRIKDSADRQMDEPRYIRRVRG